MTGKIRTTAQRYFQLAILTLAGGAVYPLIYLRQNFEVSILESFGITITELGQCYAMLGTIFVLTYVPSGWLADRIGRDDSFCENEKAILRFIKEECPEIHAGLEHLLAKV